MCPLFGVQIIVAFFGIINVLILVGIITRYANYTITFWDQWNHKFYFAI